LKIETSQIERNEEAYLTRLPRTGGALTRPDLYVVARFLDIMYKNGSPMKRTNIQLRLGLNYPKFTEYLEWLIDRQLLARTVDEEENCVKIGLTPKGLESYHRLVDWIRETVQGIKI